MGMDRPIANGTANKKKLMWLLTPLAVVILLWSGTRLLFSFLRPSISRSQVRTALVDRGPLAATIEASGLLMPETETLITSPSESRVIQLLLAPGAAVKAGDAILVLDTSQEKVELEKLAEQLALKENLKQQARLTLDQNLKKFAGDRELNELDLRFLEANQLQKQTLFKENLVSRDTLRQAQLEVDKKKIQLRQLAEAGEDAQSSARALISALDLEIRLLLASRGELENRISRATARADRDGVLTFAPQELGAPVARGEIIARIADLSQYKVKASISDFHAGRISEGLPAEIVINQKRFEGQVIKLLPSVSDGVLEFYVSLPQSGELALHANMRADVFVITDRRDNCLRLKKGPAVNGGGQQELLVIRNGFAIRVPVVTGVAGVSQLEIISGLEQGDEVVISDVTAFAHLDRVPVK